MTFFLQTVEFRAKSPRNENVQNVILNNFVYDRFLVNIIRSEESRQFLI
jgi:hypothetical protein